MHSMDAVYVCVTVLDETQWPFEKNISLYTMTLDETNHYVLYTRLNKYGTIRES